MKEEADNALVETINDLILVAAALVAIAISFLDFLGVLDKLPWLVDRVGTITLLGLSLLLMSAVLERKRRIDRMQATLDRIVSSYTFGAQYLEDAHTAASRMERIVRMANENIMAIGAKSRESGYLRYIEEAVVHRRIIHHRIVDGDSIPHSLHEHLSKLVQEPNVQISWTPSEKFGNILVTENDAVIAFATPYWERFSALWLPGEGNSRRYTQYFLELFARCMPLRTARAVGTLCRDCSKETAGNAAAITQILEEEFKAATDAIAASRSDFP